MLYNTLNPDDWQDRDNTPTQQGAPMQQGMLGQQGGGGGFLGMNSQMLMALGMGLLSESGRGGNPGAGLAKGMQMVQQMQAQAADNQWKAATFGLDALKYQSGREDKQYEHEFDQKKFDSENAFKEKELSWKMSDASFDKELKRQGVDVEQRKILLEEKKYRDEVDNQAKFRGLIEGTPTPTQPPMSTPGGPTPEAQYGPPLPPQMMAQQAQQSNVSAPVQQQGGIFDNLSPEARNIARAYSYSGKDGIGKAVEVAEKSMLTPKDRMDQESGLRKEYEAASKDYKEVSDAWSNIQASAKDPSGAGDIALLHSYIKLLNPGATVRPGQMADTQNASGISETIREQYNRALTGERLSPASRQAYISKAGDIFDTQSQNNKAAETSFREIANRNKLNPDNVIVNYRQPVSNVPGMGAQGGGAITINKPLNQMTKAELAALKTRFGQR